MKTKFTLLALLFSVVVTPTHAINAHYRAQLERSGCTQISAGDGSCDISKTKAENAAQHEPTTSVHDPLREASFSSDTVNATLSNGFFSATVNGKKASVKRLNANFYEIRGNGFVISLSLDENGITDASWNKTKGREHGILRVSQK
ncbi:hypothetical protein ASU91_06630 [Enterobacter hormaechei subsp. steigerwaltii]|uniref:hypothetical protein n=1 Tax=Enterobacter hormaechei TaxID=158836 RepID=UPI0005EE8BB7|nr:hypothetical protein [Enterobacter hormaechei]KJL77439.1 hypothetical protein SS35_03995 [Enterobacter hormaechei subsp. steigerwaltii]KJL87439.1 hypothetical protein SS24_04135 [Enterobacter hormaechei subsp. steigerwaltii]KJL92024.1 hypothetical protein SS61_04690 [Enterobacter hormaechei subsp. steigerwaltii]KJW86630.1 hypothetical protein SG70_04025 [Enterobacter hormaechei subsp. steigerwaltii]KJW88096.1 hypothetical protein SG68_02050 [Enterobacter hormaechei subsp. steigerwaltii]